MTEATLVTFPPSLDSEFSRFLLAYYGLPHREERHTLVFSSLVTMRRGHTVRFPLLSDGGAELATVAEMVDHLEARTAPERRLRPDDADPADLAADWRLFHRTLASATTVFAYYHLLPLRPVMVHALGDGTSAVERTAVRVGYPFFAGLLRGLLRLTATRERAAAATIGTVLGAVGERLADGRPYLSGDRFTLSDLAFAVAAAPVVWPDEFGGAIPPLRDTPPPLRAMIDESRRTPAGAHALRVFHTHRDPRPG
ncbi:hypothetical protein ACG83_13210 [Frankia sp. R43]|uniref:hypothetical protein n=1 Tax=Frankia sp. R43 TaxID=269536 RepID=UPI0006CA25D6|nr:hypothetical protein [Frankia sp. R43]KPM56104.1 hypothetical protein ACG83_13210 [Frankia sp. R43]